MDILILLLGNTLFLVLITLVLLIVFLADSGKTKKKDREIIKDIKKHVNS